MAALEKNFASEVVARNAAANALADLVNKQKADLAAQIKQEVEDRESDGQKKLNKLQTEI
jgi:hypothetical protein